MAELVGVTVISNNSTATVFSVENGIDIYKQVEEPSIIAFVKELAILLNGIKEIDYYRGHTFKEGNLSVKMSKLDKFSCTNEHEKLFRFLLNSSIILYNEGWLHGDIKIDNILMRGNDFQLIDFGISVAYDYSPYESPIYTLPHRSPELLLCQFDPEYASKYVHSFHSEQWAVGMTMMATLENLVPLYMSTGFNYDTDHIPKQHITAIVFLANCMGHLLSHESKTSAINDDMIKAWERITFLYNIKKVEEENPLTKIIMKHSGETFIKFLNINPNSRIYNIEGHEEILPSYRRLDSKKLFINNRLRLPPNRYRNTIEMIYVCFNHVRRETTGEIFNRMIYCIYLATYYQTLVDDCSNIDLYTLIVACAYINEAVQNYPNTTECDDLLTNRLGVKDVDLFYRIINDIIIALKGNINFTTPTAYGANSSSVLKNLLCSDEAVYDDVEVVELTTYSYLRQLDIPLDIFTPK